MTDSIQIPRPLVEVGNRARLAWGDETQERVAIGELGELLALFGKAAQGRATTADWVDEITDGFIMLTQLASMHDLEAVEKRLFEKVAKLNARVDKVYKKVEP